MLVPGATLRVTNNDSREDFDRSVLERLVPGRSDAASELRASIAAASDPYARGILLLGPSGTGQSTLARVIGLLRYLSHLKLNVAQPAWEGRHSKLERPGLLVSR